MTHPHLVPAPEHSAIAVPATPSCFPETMPQLVFRRSIQQHPVNRVASLTAAKARADA